MTCATAQTLHAGGCELGEGPGYDAATNTAWWFDIVACTLYEHDLRSGLTRSHPLPFMASMLAWTEDGRQILATEHGLFLRETDSGHLHSFCPIEADQPGTRSNDGRVHPSGTLWIGTMGKQAETGRGAIYAHDGQRLLRLFGALTIPNAICFSPDGAVAYFTDTAAGSLMRVATDPSTGLPTGEPQVLRAPAETGDPDGAVTDAEGRIWVAMWGGGRVQAYTPEGQPAGSLSVPARQPTCPAFVGPGADSMLVTSAWQGLSAAARADEPAAGDTFIFRGGIRGRHDPPYRLRANE